MISSAIGPLSAFPALRLLSAVAPLPRRKPTRCAPAALFSREIVVHGVRKWLPQLRLFAEQGGMQFGMASVSRPSIISNAMEFVVAAEISVAGATSPASFPFRHTDYTRALLSGDWAELVPGIEIKLPMTTLPTHSVLAMPDCDATDGGEIVLSFRKPIGYRVASGWLWRRATEVQLHSLVIDDNGARPVFSGLPSWIVEPRLVWADAAPKIRALITERPTGERRAFMAYLDHCRNRRIAPTPRGAERFMRERLCGSGLLALVVWMAIRSVVWLIISEYFAEETAGQADGN